MTLLASISSWGVGIAKGYQPSSKDYIAPIGAVVMNTVLLAMAHIEHVKTPFMWPVMLTMCASVASATYASGNFLGQAIRTAQIDNKCPSRGS